jgi:hypothetical protein
MIRIPVVDAILGDTVSVPVFVDEEIAGVQFSLGYDSASLTYLSLTSQVGTLNVVDDSTPGILRISIASTSAIDNPVCEISFQVHGSSELTITDAIGSTVTAQDITLSPENGGVNLQQGDTTVNVKFSWNPPTVGQNVVEGIIYVSSDGAEFSPLVSVLPDAVEQTEVLDPGQGNLFFHMRWRNPVSLSEPSGVVSLFTDAPDSPTGFSVEIV